MPDTSGRLSPDEKEKAERWLSTYWTRDNRCPISGHNNWAFGEHIVQPVASVRAGEILGVASYPQIMLICQDCGYTIYFNAVVMGIVSGAGS